MITAMNAYGTDTQTLVLTVTAVIPGYKNNYSIHFQDSVYKQYVEVKTTAAIRHGSNASWSVAGWLYYEVATNADLFSHGNSNEYRQIYLDASGFPVLKFHRPTGGGQDLIFRRNNAATADVWRHVVLVYDHTGPSAVIYVDGVGLPMTLITNTLTAAVTPTTAPMRLGCGPGNLSSAMFFDGFVDEWSYWDKALSGAEVTTLYNAGVPFDISAVPFVANLKAWLLMGDGDAFPNLSDNAAGGLHDGEMLNMTALNIMNFTPP